MSIKIRAIDFAGLFTTVKQNLFLMKKLTIKPVLLIGTLICIIYAIRSLGSDSQSFFSIGLFLIASYVSLFFAAIIHTKKSLSLGTKLSALILLCMGAWSIDLLDVQLIVYIAIGSLIVCIIYLAHIRNTMLDKDQHWISNPKNRPDWYNSQRFKK